MVSRTATSIGRGLFPFLDVTLRDTPVEALVYWRSILGFEGCGIKVRKSSYWACMWRRHRRRPHMPCKGTPQPCPAPRAGCCYVTRTTEGNSQAAFSARASQEYEETLGD